MAFKRSGVRLPLAPPLNLISWGISREPPKKGSAPPHQRDPRGTTNSLSRPLCTRRSRAPSSWSIRSISTRLDLCGRLANTSLKPGRPIWPGRAGIGCLATIAMPTPIPLFGNARQPVDRCLIQMFPSHSFCQAAPCRERWPRSHRPTACEDGGPRGEASIMIGQPPAGSGSHRTSWRARFRCARSSADVGECAEAGWIAPGACSRSSNSRLVRHGSAVNHACNCRVTFVSGSGLGPR
jgi:hypothetical protein